MKKNNPITRTCMVCKSKGEKSNFYRFVKDSNNKISFDPTAKMSGRGCYVCKSLECLDKMKKSRALNRAYKINVSEAVYDRIVEQAKSYK